MTDHQTNKHSEEELNLSVLNTFLQDSGLSAVKNYQQFSGGYSNLTYQLETVSGKSYVLRRPPLGAKGIKGGHDMLREYKILEGLRAGGYTYAPAPVIACADESVLGCPFYLMEKLNGVVLRAADAARPELTVPVMKQLSGNLVDTLVALHGLDIQATGLVSLGKPEGFVRRQTDGWIARYQASKTDDIPAMDTLAEWLDTHQPPEQSPAFIHNDFKYDNVVMTDNLDGVIALLDWEMATVGDPLIDLGTSLAYWAEAVDGDFLKKFNITWLPGNLTKNEVLQRYVEASGRDVSAFLFYYVFGLYKNAVIIQQIYTRWKNGLTKDPRFQGLIVGVQELSAMGIRALDRGRM